ncbi:MAG TPA: hypothetical protein VFG95_00525 [Nitrospiria bacterium]|nr:hypothetical protein [Nitrospiria bacterium]
MVIFVHMASVWVPFTSESKEAIADYDEIRKEILLALRECGRRLGTFLRRRERAKSEDRRRNIFELYIEEVAEACNRLKGGKISAQKLKEQLQKIAEKRTGGEKTDEILGRTGGQEGLPHSIIVTPEGIEGELPFPSEPATEAASVDDHAADDGDGAPGAEENSERRARADAKGKHDNAKRRPQPAPGSGSKKKGGTTGKSTARGRKK